jgi:hypothetical protein
MISPAIFFKALFALTGVMFLVLGFLYWIRYLLKKYSPNIKYFIKYRIFKRYNERDIEMLMEDLENNVDENELFRAILLKNKTSDKRAKELIYLYKQLKKKYSKSCKEVNKR